MFPLVELNNGHYLYMHLDYQAVINYFLKLKTKTQRYSFLVLAFLLSKLTNSFSKEVLRKKVVMFLMNMKVVTRSRGERCISTGEKNSPYANNLEDYMIKKYE